MGWLVGARIIHKRLSLRINIFVQRRYYFLSFNDILNLKSLEFDLLGRFCYFGNRGLDKRFLLQRYRNPGLLVAIFINAADLFLVFGGAWLVKLDSFNLSKLLEQPAFGEETPRRVLDLRLSGFPLDLDCLHGYIRAVHPLRAAVMLARSYVQCLLVHAVRSFMYAIICFVFQMHA